MPNRRKTPKTEAPASTSSDWPKTAEELTARAQDFARKEPAQAAGLALVAGLLLMVLPLGALFALLVRLAFALLRPMLLLLGAVKLYEKFEQRNKP